MVFRENCTVLRMVFGIHVMIFFWSNISNVIFLYSEIL